ncbi:MAG: hypothetical protein AAGE61_06985 [Pseudomonadota bacterium]
MFDATDIEVQRSSRKRSEKLNAPIRPFVITTVFLSCCAFWGTLGYFILT